MIIKGERERARDTCSYDMVREIEGGRVRGREGGRESERELGHSPRTQHIRSPHLQLWIQVL